MYKLSKEKIGKYEVYCLSDSNSNFFVKFVPEKGATVSDLRLNNRNIYDGLNNYQDLDTLAWGRGILLAPFPNRLRDGKYTFEGKKYQFPVNDAVTGTALHGFISQLKFSCDNVETYSKGASAACHTIYNGSFEYFPFPFRADVQYSLDENEGFFLKFSVKNEGDTNMPIGLGWHPYFNLDDTVNQTKIRLPQLDMIEIDRNMIPTGIKTPFKIFDRLTKIEDFILDNCFQLNGNEQTAEVLLSGNLGRLSYRQNTSIPFLQVFTPPHRKSIALEPMSCNIDAFNNGDGLEILAPGELITLECQLNLEI